MEEAISTLIIDGPWSDELSVRLTDAVETAIYENWQDRDRFSHGFFNFDRQKWLAVLQDHPRALSMGGASVGFGCLHFCGQSIDMLWSSLRFHNETGLLDLNMIWEGYLQGAYRGDRLAHLTSEPREIAERHPDFHWLVEHACTDPGGSEEKTFPVVQRCMFNLITKIIAALPISRVECDRALLYPFRGNPEIEKWRFGPQAYEQLARGLPREYMDILKRSNLILL